MPSQPGRLPATRSERQHDEGLSDLVVAVADERAFVGDIDLRAAEHGAREADREQNLVLVPCTTLQPDLLVCVGARATAVRTGSASEVSDACIA